MSNNLRLARAAVLATALAIPAVSGLSTAAFADDEYGVATGHGALIRQAAQNAPSFGQAYALATGQAAQSQAVAGNAGKSAQPVATDAAAPTVKQDLLGTGGQQDNLARQTYHPGSGTDW
jgi:hypothetical protein